MSSSDSSEDPPKDVEDVVPFYYLQNVLLQSFGASPLPDDVYEPNEMVGTHVVRTADPGTWNALVAKHFSRDRMPLAVVREIDRFKRRTRHFEADRRPPTVRVVAPLAKMFGRISNDTFRVKNPKEFELRPGESRTIDLGKGLVLPANLHACFDWDLPRYVYWSPSTKPLEGTLYNSGTDPVRMRRGRLLGRMTVYRRIADQVVEMRSVKSCDRILFSVRFDGPVNAVLKEFAKHGRPLQVIGNRCYVLAHEKTDVEDVCRGLGGDFVIETVKRPVTEKDDLMAVLREEAE